MTPERIVEVTLVGLIIGNVDALSRMCRTAAPRASVILAACALKLREEYPEAGEEGRQA
jgi:hypothetical protein